MLRQTFPYIATVDADTGNWKRRVALRDVIRNKLPQADAMVSRLIEQRLLLADSRPMADGAAPVEVIEVAHEALLRQWDTLERWLREFAAALSATESIRRSANDWQRSNRDDALLVHKAHRLESAEALLSDGRLRGPLRTHRRRVPGRLPRARSTGTAGARGPSCGALLSSRRRAPRFSGA